MYPGERCIKPLPDLSFPTQAESKKVIESFKEMETYKPRSTYCVHLNPTTMIKKLLLMITVLMAGLFQNLKAGVVTVTNLNDSGTGSLRWAIEVASSGDTIDFSVTGTIVLDTAIAWNKSLTILGPGIEDLILDGNNNTNMFTLDGGKNVIRNLAFIQGKNRVGGCIFAPPGATSDTTIIENCSFRDSIVDDAGGAVACSNGRYLIIRQCWVDNCKAPNNLGGGFFAFYGTILENSTFSKCSVRGQGGVGWIVNNVSTVTNCTFVNNQTEFRGGALYFEGVSTVTITNNTFLGNTAGDTGDAIYVEEDFFSGDGPTITFQNNIFDSPGSNYGQDPGIPAPRSSGGNISNDSSMEAFLTEVNDRNNTDPLLDMAGLQDNGGPTQTVALSESSPAIDNGISAGAPLRDQRGEDRNGSPDAGAFEYFPVVGILDNQFKTSLHVYPNPTSGKLTFDLDRVYDQVEIVITDKLGKKILTGNFGIVDRINTKIEGAAGTYFIQVRSVDSPTTLLKVLKK